MGSSARLKGGAHVGGRMCWSTAFGAWARRCVCQHGPRHPSARPRGLGRNGTERAGMARKLVEEHLGFAAYCQPAIGAAAVGQDMASRAQLGV